MLNTLLFKLSGRLPCRLIHVDGRPYLERYFVGTWLGVTVYLHRFIRGDGDRHAHNHPFNARALVLCGGYIEQVVSDISNATPEGVVTYEHRVRFWNAIPSNKFHRITHVTPGTWTLVLRGGRVTTSDGIRKGWGFLERNGGGGDIAFRPAPGGGIGAWHNTAHRGSQSGRVQL